VSLYSPTAETNPSESQDWIFLDSMIIVNEGYF